MNKSPSQRLLTSFAVLSCLASLVSACGDGGEGEGSGGGTASGGASVGSGGGAASGGSSTAGSGGSGSAQLPTDNSLASIEAFLAAGSYKSWVHDAAPRPNGSATLKIHGDLLQVYFNDLAVIAAEAESTAAPGAMVVKEIYDTTTGALLGTAVSITPDTSGKWFYYCANAGVDLCSSGGEPTDPFYDPASGDSNCHSCHGDLILAKLPQP